MVKSQLRIIGALAILLMLGASPLSVNYGFAENDENQVQNRELRAILTEKMVDGKLQVHHYALPEDLSDKDLKRMLSFDGQMSWAYVNYKAYQSGIVLFDGKASKVGENLWEISTNGVLTIGEEKFDLDLDGKSNGSRVLMHGTASNEDLSYKVIFSGNIAQTEKENAYAISFMNSGIKNPEMGQNIKFLQIGELTIKSEKSIGSNQEFKNSISVK